MRNKSGLVFILACAFMAASPVYAKDNSKPIEPVSLSDSTASQSYSISHFFRPRPQEESRKKAFDYNVLATLLDTAVFYTGVSTRRRASRVQAPVGTRVTTNAGHTSPYRLEGNKVLFSVFNDEYKATLSAYQQELEALGNQVDITSLPRNEQLAYWLNLHNVTMLDQLSQNYPVRTPRKLLIGSNELPLHEAKVIRIKGQNLSLRDIREKIVFTHWKNPNVIYGFFQGDLGSPSLQTAAFNGRNVSNILSDSANEFTNSLRGIYNTRRKVYVSRIFYEAAPYYFPNFSSDLKQHLRTHLREDVAELLDIDTDFRMAKYQTRIADLTGGVGNRLLAGSGSVARRYGNGTVRDAYLLQFQRKQEALGRQGRLRRGTVIIDDVFTVGSGPTEVK